jgi:hypothetical protein
VTLGDSNPKGGSTAKGGSLIACHPLPAQRQGPSGIVLQAGWRPDRCVPVWPGY